MLNISNQTGIGNVGPVSSPTQEYGAVLNETAPGVKDGTKLAAQLVNDTYYALYAVIQKYTGVVSDAIEDTDLTSGTQDFLSALREMVNVEADVGFTDVTDGTGGASELSQSAAGVYTYNIADFDGTGLNPAQMRVLHVKCVSALSLAGSTAISATYPDEATHTICAQLSGDSGDSRATSLVADIPIIAGQPSVDITIVGAGSSFTIFGATQRSYIP